MEEVEKAIKSALAADLPGAEIRFDPYPGYGKLHTTVVWDKFEDELIIDRQRRVWDILRSSLTEEQRHKTGFLLTVTSTEINAMQEALVSA